MSNFIVSFWNRAKSISSRSREIWKILVHTIILNYRFLLTPILSSGFYLKIWTISYFMYLCKNFRWKSLLMVSLMKRFGVLVSPRAWFLNTTSSSHLLFTLKDVGLLISGFPRRSSASLDLSSSSRSCRSFRSFSSALSFLICSSSSIRAASSSSSSSSSLSSSLFTSTSESSASTFRGTIRSSISLLVPVKLSDLCS
jgi:hypothetical protein